MKLFASILCVQVVSFAASCGAAQAAAPGTEKAPSGILLPPPVEVSSPFAMNAPAAKRASTIAFLPQASMAAPDRQVVRAAAPALRARAALRGFDLEQGDWNYQQIACPILPDSILLLFTRNNGVGDVSEFSAVLPRSANQPLRILPILRRGYSPYDPAPVNAITIAAFNALRAAVHPAQKQDWLTTGLCYAALSGVRVQLTPTRGESADTISLAGNSLLQVEEDGEAVVRFLDLEKPAQIMSWDLAFDKNGNLTRVTVAPVPVLNTRILP